MGDVTQNVIFKIGTIGVTSSAADIAKLTAAYVLLQKGISYVQNSLLPLSKVYRSMNDEQLQAADALGKSTGGLLDTLDQFRIVQKASAAGLPDYRRTVESIGKVIVDYSERMGESQEEAGARINKVLDGLIKGSPLAARQLREYGITIDTTTTKVDDFRKAATDAFVDKAKDIQLNVGSVDTAIRQLTNAIDDAPAAMIAMINNTDVLSGAVESLTTALGQLRTSFLDAPDTGANFFGFMSSIIEDNVDLALAAFEKIAGAMDWISGKKSAAYIKALRDSIYKSFQAGREVDYQSESAGQSRINRTKVRSGGGGGGVGGRGGGKKTKTDEMTFTLEEAQDTTYGALREETDWRKGMGTFSDQIDLIGGEADADAIRDAADAQRLFNETKQQQLEILREKVALLGEDPDALSLEDKQYLWDAEYEHEEIMRQYNEERMKYLEARMQKENNFAADFKAVWMNAMDGVKTGTLAGNAAFSAMEATIGNVVTTLIQGGNVSGKVIARMVRDVAIGSSVQATILGLLELVKAAIAYAAPFGSGTAQGAKHTAAAAEAFAMAAVMAGLAVMTNAAAGGYGGGRGRSSGSAGGSIGYSSAGNTMAPTTENINLTNTIVLDGEPIYQSVEQRAISRSQRGSRGLAMSNT